MERFPRSLVILLLPFAILAGTVVFWFLANQNSIKPESASQQVADFRPKLRPGISIEKEVIVWGFVDSNRINAKCSYLALIQCPPELLNEFCALNHMVDGEFMVFPIASSETPSWWRVPTDGGKQFSTSTKTASGSSSGDQGLVWRTFQVHEGNLYYLQNGYDNSRAK
jgi:hypothetical protein